MRTALFIICALALVTPGCDDPDGDGREQDDLVDEDNDAGDAGSVDEAGFRFFKGVNGDACAASTYNCKLRASGGNRVATNDVNDNNSWGLVQGVPVRDGNGTIVAYNAKPRTTFNYGQLRTFDGVEHVFAVSTSNSSSGWMPKSSISGESGFTDKLGKVSAVGEGLAKLGCYEIRNSHDTSIEFKKVVYDSKVSHERAGDYLPLVRANGARSVNLIFNVPGFSLGGVAIDHFPAGTKFRRYDVPTNDGPASIDIPLYVQDGEGRFRLKSGTMKFIYGYVIAATGTKRNGWMAYDALQVSGGCP